MKTSCLFVLLFSISLFSQNCDLLILRSNISDFKKIELGVKSQLRKKYTVRSVSPNTDTEFKNSITTNSPRITLIMGKRNLRMLRKLARQNVDFSNTSFLILSNDYTDNTLKNSCIISYKSKIKQYIDLASTTTGRSPKNIGILFSTKSKSDLSTLKAESNRINISVHSKEIFPSSLQNSMKNAVKDLTSHNNVDLLIVLNDNLIINKRNISTLWKPLLAPVEIPVAVPSDYFYELEPRIGSFTIKPHFREIGRVIGKVVLGAGNNNWVVREKSIYTDKSILYFRNADGSISRKNYIQNNVVATLHPTSTSTQSEVSLASNISIPTQQPPAPTPVKTREKITPAKKSPLPAKAKPVATVSSKNVTPPTTASPLRKTPITSNKPVQAKSNTTRNLQPVTEKKPPKIPAQEKVAINTTMPDTTVSKKIPSSAVKSKLSGYTGFDYQFLIALLALIITAILIVCLFLVVKILKHGKKNRYNCLLIAKNNKKLKYSKLYTKDIALGSYLKNHAFNVTKITDIDKKGVSSLFTLPDLICVDWQFSDNVQNDIYNLLSEGMCTSNFILIFYNVPDISEINKNNYFDHRTFFLDTECTISGISKILSCFLSDSHALQITHPTKSCLEGKITDDTLSEIFQMMDTGKKTGCLLIEDHHPVGMLFFEDGLITYAITGTQITEQAVFEILSTKHGRFKFIPGKKPVKKQMHLDTVAVLMKSAQIVDESTPIEPSHEEDHPKGIIDATIFESKFLEELEPDTSNE